MQPLPSPLRQRARSRLTAPLAASFPLCLRARLQCGLFPVQHNWARPYLICPKHPTTPALLEPAVPEVQDLSPSPNEPAESSAILKFVTELPSAANNSPYCGPQSTAWYELQIQEDGQGWVSQEKSIKSSVVRKKHLKAGRVYRFRVRIVHNGSPSGWSEESAPLKHGHIVSKEDTGAHLGGGGAAAPRAPAAGASTAGAQAAQPAQAAHAPMRQPPFAQPQPVQPALQRPPAYVQPIQPHPQPRPPQPPAQPAQAPSAPRPASPQPQPQPHRPHQPCPPHQP